MLCIPKLLCCRTSSNLRDSYRCSYSRHLKQENKIKLTEYNSLVVILLMEASSLGTSKGLYQLESANGRTI